MEVKVSQTNRGERCFLIDGCIFKSDKILKKIDHVKYYCHCDLIANGCTGRSVVTFRDETFIAKVTKNHIGHAEQYQRWSDIQFRENLKSKVICHPERSHKTIYDETVNQALKDKNKLEKGEVASAIADFVC